MLSSGRDMREPMANVIGPHYFTLVRRGCSHTESAPVHGFSDPVAGVPPNRYLLGICELRGSRGAANRVNRGKRYRNKS